MPIEKTVPMLPQQAIIERTAHDPIVGRGPGIVFQLLVVHVEKDPPVLQKLLGLQADRVAQGLSHRPEGEHLFPIGVGHNRLEGAPR